MTNSEEKSLPKKIAEDIIAFILEENLHPGDKLPNETVLCERLNVGRSSLREAMKALASRNITAIVRLTAILRILVQRIYILSPTRQLPDILHNRSVND